MAADIVPELYEKIHADFERKINSSRIIKTFRGRLEKKTADAKGVSFYAAEAGRCAADVLSRYLTEEYLPEGKLYWNILERTVVPLLREVNEMIMEAAKAQLILEDEKAGINLKPVEPDFPEYRIRDFMNKLMSFAEEAADE